MKCDFIEIGTSDFDTEIQICDDNAIGLTIESIKFYLDRLPNKKNVIKINSAMSNYNGFTDVYYVNDDMINKFNLPSYIKGQNSIGSPHPEIKHFYKFGLIENDISKENVVVKNFENLFNEFKIESINLLKIDTEGHDCIILNDYIDFSIKNNKKLANKILFETNVLSNINEVNDVIKKCVNYGYEIISTGENTILQFK